MQKIEFVGEQVFLRTLNNEYIDPYLAMFSPLVRSILHVTSTDAEKLYLQERIELQAKHETFFYCIFDMMTDQLIGAVEIRNQSCSRGQLYCWVHESFWGTHKFKEGIEGAAHLYFKKTGHLFFSAKVDVSNKRSYFALKKAGFVDIGMGEGPHDKQYELLLRNKNMLSSFENKA